MHGKMYKCVHTFFGAVYSGVQMGVQLATVSDWKTQARMTPGAKFV